MRIVVRGRHCELSEDVRQAAVEKLSRVRRLFDRFHEMDVFISSWPHSRSFERFHCEVVLRAKRSSLTASAYGPDAMTAIDRAEAKITRQVRKLKTRRVERPRLVAAGSRST